MSRSELQRGGEAAAREAARRAAGRDRSDETASDFDDGYVAGRAASDPESNASSQDVKKGITDKYKGLNEDERAAFRDGYAAGANQN
jgi:hypothetical protein